MKHQTTAHWFRPSFVSSISLPSSAIGSIWSRKTLRSTILYLIFQFILSSRGKLRRAIGPRSSRLFTQCQTLDQNTINGTKETNQNYLSCILVQISNCYPANLYPANCRFCFLKKQFITKNESFQQYILAFLDKVLAE